MTLNIGDYIPDQQIKEQMERYEKQGDKVSVARFRNALQKRQLERDVIEMGNTYGGIGRALIVAKGTWLALKEKWGVLTAGLIVTLQLYILTISILSGINLLNALLTITPQV